MHSASDLLQRLDTLGVTVTAVDGDLVLRPASAVPKEMVPELRKRKSELMRTLADGQAGSPEVDADDPSTWPPYVRRIEATAREHFGDDAARRQVCAEIAFLNGCAQTEGWIVVTSNAEHHSYLGGEREGKNERERRSRPLHRNRR